MTEPGRVAAHQQTPPVTPDGSPPTVLSYSSPAAEVGPPPPPPEPTWRAYGVAVVSGVVVGGVLRAALPLVGCAAAIVGPLAAFGVGLQAARDNPARPLAPGVYGNAAGVVTFFAVDLLFPLFGSADTVLAWAAGHPADPLFWRVYTVFGVSALSVVPGMIGALVASLAAGDRG